MGHSGGGTVADRLAPLRPRHPGPPAESAPGLPPVAHDRCRAAAISGNRILTRAGRPAATRDEPRARDREADDVWRRAGYPGGDAHHARAAPLVAPGRAPAAALLRAARGRRDDRVPPGGARGPAPRDRRPLGRAAGRDAGIPPLRLQDGDGRRQDDRHGDARVVEHPQQGERPRRRALLGRGAGRVPERHHPRSAARARPRPGRGERVPDARPRARAPHALAHAGPRARHELARVREAGGPDRGRLVAGRTRRRRRDLDRDRHHRRADDHRARFALPHAAGVRGDAGVRRAARGREARRRGHEVQGRGDPLRRERRRDGEARARPRPRDQGQRARHERRGAPRLPDPALRGRGRARGAVRRGGVRGPRGGRARGDRLGRGARSHPRGPRDQLLPGPFRDALLPARGRARREPALPVGGERLLARGRDRVGAREDPAARGARRGGHGAPGVLQHLGVDPAAAHGRRARRPAGKPEARGDPQVRRRPADAARPALEEDTRGLDGGGADPPARLHRRVQDHEDREGRPRVDGRGHEPGSHPAVRRRRAAEPAGRRRHHPRGHQGGPRDRLGRGQGRRDAVDAAHPRHGREGALAGGPPGPAHLPGGLRGARGQARETAPSAGARRPRDRGPWTGRPSRRSPSIRSASS